MDMKKMVMAATLLSVFAGGEVSALAAKTTHHSVAKITHVKVTKHKVSGYTTPESHIKLMKLKHGEKASATANHKGKFVIKVKNNNLSKLKFKIKATKHGLKARTYVHKVKKAAQSIDGGNTGSQATPTPAPTTPDSSSESKKPEKPAAKPGSGVQHSGGHSNTIVIHETPAVTDQIANAKEALKNAQKNFDDFINDKNNTSDGKAIASLSNDDITVIKDLAKAQHDVKIATPSQKNAKQESLKAIQKNNATKYEKVKKLTDNDKKQDELYNLVHKLEEATTTWQAIQNAINTNSNGQQTGSDQNSNGGQQPDGNQKLDGGQQPGNKAPK